MLHARMLVHEALKGREKWGYTKHKNLSVLFPFLYQDIPEPHGFEAFLTSRVAGWMGGITSCYMAFLHIRSLCVGPYVLRFRSIDWVLGANGRLSEYKIVSRTLADFAFDSENLLYTMTSAISQNRP